MLEKIFEVEEKHTALSVGSGSLRVLSTPYLSAFMENVGFELVEKIVENGETSVGTYIEVKHLKASKVGSKIRIIGKIVEKNNKRIKIDIKAYENESLVGECLHERVIINIEKFMSKIY